MENKQLKHRGNGRVLPFSEELAKHPDMMLMIDGKVIGVVDKSSKGSGNKRTKTKFLYNPVNGRIFPWCELTAKERPDLIGVDDIDEIPGYMTQPISEPDQQTIHDEKLADNGVNEPDSYNLSDNESGSDDKADNKQLDSDGGQDSEADEGEEVNLDTMTKKDLIEFANIEYEVELDMSMKKSEMKAAIEKLAEQAG